MQPGRRILFVTEKFPWPIDDGGQIRTWHVLSKLAAELPVSLLSLAPADPAHLAPVRELGIEVATFPKRRSRLRSSWYASKALWTRRPWPLEKNASPEMLAEIRRRIAAREVGALHFNHLDTAQYVEDLGAAATGVSTVFDTHNLLTKLYERLVESAADPLRRAYCTIQWWKMARYEREILKRVGQALVCSDVEREQLATWGVDRALVVPNGVDTEHLAPNGRAPRVATARAELVFVGALSYLPNDDGLRWFLSEVVPELERVLPDFHLTVVGRDPSSAVRSLAGAHGAKVELAGFVDDFRPRVHAADACIVPLRIGGGTRLKILDAFALGCPVVSTRVGAEGILAKDREHLLLADSPADFARAIAEVCSDAALARRLAENARELVLARYDWRTAVAPLVEHYRYGVR